VYFIETGEDDDSHIWGRKDFNRPNEERTFWFNPPETTHNEYKKVREDHDGSGHWQSKEFMHANNLKELVSLSLNSSCRTCWVEPFW
jgi:hypothetical protein